MILGCGVDLIEVARLEQEVARRGESLIDELLGAGELAWCRRSRRTAARYAVAYAAKEALFKAIGTGKAGRMAWHDIELAWPDEASRPVMTLSGETAAVAEAMGVRAVHVALASSQEYGAAWVVLIGRATDESRVPSPESRQ